MKKSGNVLLLLWLCLVVGGVAFASSCSDDGDDESTCTFNSDCGEGEICVDAVCREGCFEDRDCPELYVCLEGECASTTCRSDSDCRFGQACKQGFCEDVAGACAQNSDCAADEVCSRDTMVCIPNEGGRVCATLGDCFAGEECVENRCVERGDPECVEDRDCAGEQLCQSGQCVDRQAECAFNSDCGAGRVCNEGRCESECIEDQDCGFGAICESGGCQTGCRSSIDCTAGLECVSNQCRTPQEECSLNSDCPAGQVCRNGECQDECRANTDCDAGQECVGGRCQAAQDECALNSDCGAGEMCVNGNCEEERGPFEGEFSVSALNSPQNCFFDLLGVSQPINLGPRIGTATQSGSDRYIFRFPPPPGESGDTIYSGSITSNGTFEVRANGLWQGDGCGGLISNNAYTATFSGDGETFQGTLSAEFFGPRCGTCYVLFEIEGVRLR